jgi:hypothetical protein
MLLLFESVFVEQRMFFLKESFIPIIVSFDMTASVLFKGILLYTHTRQLFNNRLYVTSLSFVLSSSPFRLHTTTVYGSAVHDLRFSMVCFYNNNV